MGLGVQAKLLRALERREFRRVGGTAKITVDLNLVAATNANLEDQVRAGRFREDLYYRLKVVTIAVPPLRERREAIPVLAERFLAEVAERTGLSRAEVIRRHTDPTYDVHFLGFVPGFAYLGPLDPALVLPRRAAPRRRVPAGTVAIAGAQTGVYPLETPGGWHLIGHTDAVLFDPARDPPNLLAAGDRVRFSPVGE